MAPIHKRLSPNHDARNTLNVRRRRQKYKRKEASHGYHPHHDGHYDSGGPKPKPWSVGTLGFRSADPQHAFPSMVSTTYKHPKIL
jgi:hypothetical protein